MPLKLYGDNRSPCVRAVLLTASTLNVKLEYVPVNVIKGEHLTEEYLKKNPRHTVPTLDDDGFYLWDSHAIMIYLCEKYGNDNAIYPKDIQKRSKINQMLYFEAGDIFAYHSLVIKSFIRNGGEEPSKEAVDALQKGYAFLEKFLKNTKFIAANEMSIVDFSVWCTVSNSRCLVPIEASKYPYLGAWIKQMDSLPISSLNGEGNAKFFEFINSIKNK